MLTSKIKSIKCMKLVWSFIPATKPCVKEAFAALFPGGREERMLRKRRTQLQITREVFRSKPGKENQDLYYPFEQGRQTPGFNPDWESRLRRLGYIQDTYITLEAAWAKHQEDVANQKRRVKKRQRKLSKLAGPVTQKKTRREILRFYQREVVGIIEAERPFEGEWSLKKATSFSEETKNLVFSEAPPLFKPKPLHIRSVPTGQKL